LGDLIGAGGVAEEGTRERVRVPGQSSRCACVNIKGSFSQSERVSIQSVLGIGIYK